MPNHTNQMSRRTFIRASAAGAIVSAIGLPLLVEACSPATPAQPTAGGPASAPPAPTAGAPTSIAAAPTTSAPPAAGALSTVSAPTRAAGAAGKTWAGVTLPTYVPFQAPNPDFPASDDGIVPAGYVTYPKNLVKTSKGPFGNGEDVSLFTYEPNPPPTPLDQNAAWQAINKAMGVNLKYDNVPLQDYIPKLTTLIAGGTLTDVISMNLQGAFIPSELQFFEQSCADLTPFLSGDAVKAYPNLANLPPDAWKLAIFNGKIYGVPRVTNAVGANLLVAQHMLDAAGVKKDFKNTDDFTSALKALTIPGSRWGIGGLQAFNPNLTWLMGIFGAPNNWAVDANAKFTKDWETEAYKAAVAYARSLWDQQLFDTNTPSFIQQTGAYKFYSGEMAMYPAEYAFFGINWFQTLQANPDFKLSTIPEFPAATNVKPVHLQSSGVLNIAVFKKGNSDRIKQVLQVLNFLASPFGSEEYLLVNSGVKDSEYTLDANGNPILTAQGQRDVQLGAWSSTMAAPQVLYDTLGGQDMVKIASPLEMAAHRIAITDSSLGLYSPTDAAKRAVLSQNVYDGVNGIIFGRNDVSTLDQVIKDWRSAGGDQMRAEYEQAYAANK